MNITTTTGVSTVTSRASRCYDLPLLKSKADMLRRSDRKGGAMAAVRSVAVVGVTYAAIGIVFAWPTSHVHVWRAGAWVLSAMIYSTHIAYERFRMNNRPRRAALRVASAVVIGGFGLALSALLHSSQSWHPHSIPDCFSLHSFSLARPDRHASIRSRTYV